jgi:hypothetical protein
MTLIEMERAQELVLSAPAPQATGLRREHFIPISRSELIHRLSETAGKETGTVIGEAASAFDLFRYLAAWRHLGYRNRLSRLNDSYLPFTPDRDTLRVQIFSEDQLNAKKQDLVSGVTGLLVQANYTKIDKNELENLLGADSAHGLELDVDLSEYDQILLFARGEDEEKLTRRLPETLYLRKKIYPIPFYKRLFLLLKLKPFQERVKEVMEERQVSERKARRIVKKHRKGLPEDDQGSYIYLKLFKNIPRADLQMLFPNTAVKLRPFDKIKLSVTAGGGAVAGTVGSISKVTAALAAASPIGLAGALLGLVGIIFRQVMNVFNTRTKYMMMLAQKLFFHSLANNQGVLTLLVDGAEEEDIKEEMLLYFFLLRHPLPHHELRQNGELDRLIEAFLTREFGISVDFDMEDAYSRLHADGLLSENTDGIIEALPPQQASRHLEQKWCDYLGTIS